MRAAVVVPAADADRWLTRLAEYAGERGIEIGAVVVVSDQTRARRDLLRLLVDSEVDGVLCAFASDLPRGFLIEAAVPVAARPAQRRPRPIERAS